jgi:hypothetical protein
MDMWELVILGLLISAAGTWSAYDRWQAEERMGAVAILMASWGVGLLRFGWPVLLFLVPDAASVPSLAVLPLTFMVPLAIEECC